VESIRIELPKPTVSFVVEGKDLVTFGYYELTAAIDDAFRRTKEDKSLNTAEEIRLWMVSKGLPSEITAPMVSDWVAAFDRVMDDRAKKATGS